MRFASKWAEGLFVNLHLIRGVKETNGNLLMIQDMARSLQDPRRCWRGAAAHTWWLGIRVWFWHGLPPRLQAVNAVNFHATRATRNTALTQKTLPPTADIWERGFPSMAKHWTCSTRKTIFYYAKSTWFTSKGSWNSELTWPLIFHIANATNSFLNSHASLFNGECGGKELVCRSFQAAY